MSSLNAAVAELGADFADLPVAERLNLLLEYSEKLPEIPSRLADHPDLLERVVECQSPVYLTVEVNDDIVQIYITAPRESPTTRGFASIMHELLNGRQTAEVMAAPDTIPDDLALGEAVSPLRLRGMRGMLARIKRQVEKHASSGL